MGTYSFTATNQDRTVITNGITRIKNTLNPRIPAWNAINDEGKLSWIETDQLMGAMWDLWKYLEENFHFSEVPK